MLKEIFYAEKVQGLLEPAPGQWPQITWSGIAAKDNGYISVPLVVIEHGYICPNLLQGW